MLTQNRTSPIVKILVVLLLFLFHQQSAFAVIAPIPIESVDNEKENIQKDNKNTVAKRENHKIEKLKRKLKRINEPSEKKRYGLLWTGISCNWTYNNFICLCCRTEQVFSRDKGINGNKRINGRKRHILPMHSV